MDPLILSGNDNKLIIVADGHLVPQHTILHYIRLHVFNTFQVFHAVEVQLILVQLVEKFRAMAKFDVQQRRLDVRWATS